MVKKHQSVTRDDVARVARVSAATVSYVVNNGPRPVASETRKRVLQAIDRLGYKPNAIARNLRLRRSATIGLIVPDTHNPYFAEVARGVEQMASENDLTVILCHSDYKLERELHYVDVLRTERAAGVIWFPATNSPEPAVELDSYGMPLVVLDRTASEVQAPAVISDNFLGGYLVTKHLIELGHRVLGCITRPEALHHSSERLRGFQAALVEHDIDLDDSLIMRGGFHLEDGRAAAEQLVRHSLSPSAIFAYNDIMAIGALRAAYEMGLKVPDDLSIVGFDDIPQAAFTCPALTTVSQPKIEMGRQGVAILVDMLHGRDIDRGATLPLPVKLIVRESTGAYKYPSVPAQRRSHDK
jgi:LacI family transcriptional regulator, galactose operon repressor